MADKNIFLKSLKTAGLYVLISLLVTNMVILFFKMEISHFIIGNICSIFIPLASGFFGTLNHLFHHREVEHLNWKLEKMAKYDPLTNIYNRRTFMENFEEILEKANRNHQYLSFCLLDIDHFKKVNDTYGHLCGDAVLQQLSRIIETNIREQDFLCRFGGEEFCILMPGMQQEEAYQYIQNIKKKINNYEFDYKGIAFKITISFGLFFKAPREESRVDDIVHSADLALYIAKNKGRDRIEVYANVS